VGIVALGDFAIKERGQVDETLQQISEPSPGSHAEHRPRTGY